MANLFFPQLLTGALVQYPLHKIKQLRTVMNVSSDGSITAYPDTSASRVEWVLQFDGISGAEVAALQALYAQCVGPLSPFTFIDPTDNMIVSSSDLTRGPWSSAASCILAAGIADPFAGNGGFTLVNPSQLPAGLQQTLPVPSNYRYCFSVYVRSAAGTTVTLQLAGSSTSQTQCTTAGSAWTRLVLSGKLNDPGSSLSVSILVAAGESVQLYGPQLEAQYSPSSYKVTTSRGGVYPVCHWTDVAMTVTATGPDTFSTKVGIETNI